MEYECVFDPFGSSLPTDLYEIAVELSDADVDARVTATGFIVAVCDGRSPEYLTSVGCQPDTNG